MVQVNWVVVRRQKYVGSKTEFEQLACVCGVWVGLSGEKKSIKFINAIILKLLCMISKLWCHWELPSER